MKFDSKTDKPEKFLVTLQTKAAKAYPDPDPPAVAPIDPHAEDAAVEQTRFDQDTARRAEIRRSAQEARSVQIRRQFIKIMPDWLRSKLPEQPENTTVEDLVFLHKKSCQFIIFVKQSILLWTHLAKWDLRLQIHLLFDSGFNRIDHESRSNGQ